MVLVLRTTNKIRGKKELAPSFPNTFMNPSHVITPALKKESKNGGIPSQMEKQKTPLCAVDALRLPSWFRLL
jgi:hypothetical protein